MGHIPSLLPSLLLSEEPGAYLPCHTGTER